MKPVPAIVEKAIDIELSYSVISVAMAGERDADASARRHEGLALAARETAKLRRLEIGRELLKVRMAWPASGPRAKGWSEFLARVKLDDSTAVRYMQEARTGATHGEPGPAPRDSAHEPDVSQTGPRIVPDPGAPAPVAPFRQLTEGDLIQALARLDPEARKRIIGAGKANVAGGSGDPARGQWCTPKALAGAVGPWDVDPFSNPRSHIAAVNRCMLENGGDGFGDGSGPGSYRVSNREAEYADERTRVWIQPDYSMVLDAVDHYKHTRFCALLRWSPDVEWFARIWPYTRAVAFPIGERIEFEPPDGVPSSGGAPYPHALFYADPRDITDAVRATCIVWLVPDDLREVVARIWGTKINPTDIDTAA